jgi:cell division protein FtsQ
MKRVRPNRRKPAKRELPKLPQLPRLPRFTVNFRAVFASVATLVVCAIAVALGRELLELPVKRLEITGNFQRVSKLEIEAAADALGQSFLSVDLHDIRQRVEALAWVDEVRLRRVWPDMLSITFREHRAAARWGATGLLNIRGDLFAEDVLQEYRELPRLDGPPGSHRRVADRYLKVQEELAGTRLMLDSIRMDERGAFTIDFISGLSVRIGRDDVEERIDRFFDIALTRLEPKIGEVSYVDMRYANGFAVGWRMPAPNESTLARLGSGG